MFRFSASKPHNEGAINTDECPSRASKPKSNGIRSEKRQITRNRTSYSCLTCRRRKVKCDKVRPICGGCQKANEDCSYGEDDAPAAESVQSDAWREDGGLASKKRKSSLASRDSFGVPAVSSGPAESAPPAPLKAIEEQLQRLTSMVDALRQNGGSDLRLRDLLTPVPSNSDHESDDMQSRPNLSLDMFQPSNQALTKDPTELSRPLSSLKLSNTESNLEDPFWNYVSEEIDQLNLLMRRRNNQYASATSLQNKQCDRPREFPPQPKEGHAPAREDFWDPASFHKEAGLETIEFNPDNSCSICRNLPLTKASLLHNVPLKCPPQTAIHHLMCKIPTRAQSNVLLRCWLSGVYPILGILLPGDILKKHEDFWAQVEAKGLADFHNPDPEFLAVIHAIWYAGSLSISTKGIQRWFPDTTRAKLSAQFHDQTVLCLHAGYLTRTTTLYKLAAFVLLHSMPAAEEDPIQGSLYMQLAVRLALTMGLHREPTLFDLSASEAATRRRLWWQIIQLDVSLVVASGYPSQISEAFCDTRIVCADKDCFLAEDDLDISSSDKTSKTSSPTSVDSNGDSSPLGSYRTLALVAKGKSILSCALRSVISIHLGTKMLTNADMQQMKSIMKETHEQVEAIMKQIPAKGLPELGFIPDGPKEGHKRALDCDAAMSSPVTPKEIAYYRTSVEADPSAPLASYYRQRQASYNKWARISLSMLLDKMYCVAYAPFLKNTKSKLWSVGRQCALHNCHSFMRKFVSLASDPDLEPFRWSWPAMYGPMHAALIVLVDLYERPCSVEAPRSRELVDKMFSLATPQFGIVGGPNGVTAQRPLREGGIEAWDMLRGLRSAAWQRAGLDPTVLWSEDDQVEVGIATPLTDAQKIAQSLREDSIYETNRTPTNGVSSTATSKQDTKSTEHGVRYLVKLAQNEMTGPEEGESSVYPCGRAMRNQFLQGIENDARLNPERRLARREGQQKMPFPLSGRMEKCSGHAATQDGSADPLINLPVPGTVTMRSPCQASRSMGAEEDSGARNAMQAATPPSSDPGQHDLEQSVTTEANGSHDRSSINPVLLSESGANGAILGNGFHDSYRSNLQSHHGDESHRDVKFSDLELQHDEAPSTSPDLGFDWERWDAVFGQYSGFTDLMEDVTWDEHLDD